MPRCPSCDVPLTREEAAGSQCPVCKGSLGHGRPANADVFPVEQPAPTGSYSQCYFCGRREPCETGYCRIGYVNWWVFFVTQRWLKTRCQSCADCRQAFAATKRLRILIGLAMIGLPMMVCVGIYLPFFAAAKGPNFQPGQSGEVAVALGLLCMPWVITIPLGFFLMRSTFMNRVMPRLDRERAEALRTTLGSWGFLPSIFFSQKKPWLDSEYIDAL
jgi:hypothetical protein